MQITLKRARKCEKLLREALAATVLSQTVRVSVFGETDVESVSKAIGVASKSLAGRYDDYKRGMEALQRLRIDIGRENARLGIHDLMAEHGVLLAIAKKLADVEVSAPPSANELSRRTEAQRGTDMSFRSNSETSDISPVGLAEDLVAVRRRKLAAEDELARLNQVTEIELDADVQAVLERYGLL